MQQRPQHSPLLCKGNQGNHDSMPPLHRSLRLLYVLLLLPCPASTSTRLAPTYDYCIVGGGPGGLQVGHYMHRAGWDYALFERSHGAGTFFERYPVHRQLISLNKRFTGRTDPEFNLRHDWNSLLGQDAAQTRPMTNRSTLRFPAADTLVEYLRDFAKEQDAAGRIFYRTRVRRVSRKGGERKTGPLVLDVDMDVDAGIDASDSSDTVECGAVIMATGVGVPHMPARHAELRWDGATLYGDMPRSTAATNYAEYGEQYSGQRALVIGMGNAALETADALAPHVAYVHVLPGRSGKIRVPLFAHETRYVGDVRMHRASIFDSYLLKSLDGGLNGGAVAADSHFLARCGPGGKQYCLVATGTLSGTLDFWVAAASPTARGVVDRLEAAGHVLRRGGGRQKGDVFPTRNTRVACSLPGNEEQRVAEATAERAGWAKDDIKGQRLKLIGGFSTQQLRVVLSQSVLDNPELVMAIAVEMGNTGSPYPLIYDVVVHSAGWKHDLSPYDDRSGTRPTLQPSEKFPVLDATFAAVGVPHLYFAGVAAHGKDHKKGWQDGGVRGWWSECLFSVALPLVCSIDVCL